MKNTKIVKNLSFTLFVIGLILVIAGCGSDNEDTNDGANAPVTEAPIVDVAETPIEDTDVDVYQDLQDVRTIVAENLEWGGTVWDDIMLADDVPSPEMKYGLLVVPFFPSELVARHTRTVSIDSGNFVVEIVSAETGLSWTIDQDGVIAGGN